MRGITCGRIIFASGIMSLNLPDILKNIFGFAPSLQSPEQARLALKLYPRLEYGVQLTGRGCPFRCKYCVGWKLHPTLRRKPVEMVIDEIKWQTEKLGLQNIAFYDDALILYPEGHIMPILEGIIRAGIKVKFHTPNGIHLRPLNLRAAQS